MRTVNIKISDDKSMGLSFASESILLDEFEGGSIQALWTGTAAGTFVIQYTNVKDPVDADWMSDTATELAVSAPGTQGWLLAKTFFRSARVKYTATSGAGACDIIFNGKGE